jgi:hypothetical protein
VTSPENRDLLAEDPVFDEKIATGTQRAASKLKDQSEEAKQG